MSDFQSANCQLRTVFDESALKYWFFFLNLNLAGQAKIQYNKENSPCLGAEPYFFNLKEKANAKIFKRKYSKLYCLKFNTYLLEKESNIFKVEPNAK